MQRNYLAIDLRGYPSDLFEAVCEVVPAEDFPLSKRGITGVEVFTSSQLRNIPKGVDLIFARGGTVQRNRKFLDSKRINVLSCPYPFDSVQARRAAENRIALELCFREVMNAQAYLRAKVLASFQKTVNLARKYHAPLVITSGSSSDDEVKSPRQLVAFGKVLGLDYSEAKASIYTIPRRVLEGFE